MRDDYDIIVIGGGHAGAEAAWAAARLGARTALVTFQRAAIGRMSCNPAIGGIGKGQMVREIDALGGLMGLATDEAGIQFRMLNRSKGPAVWAPRAQCDREHYAAVVQRLLSECPNLTIIEAGVESLVADAIPLGHGGDGSDHVEPPPRLHSHAHAAAAPSSVHHRIAGVRLTSGTTLAGRAVVVTSGTFLRALMHCGEQKTPGGRIGEAAADGLSRSLAALGLTLGRLKTGTPPRVHRDSVDYARLEIQPGDDPPVPFSFLTEKIGQPQIPCWIAFTSPAVHDVIRANLDRAPMYSGQIASRGPRYCPSIEDKVVRFADKDRHQLFLEPEGRASDRIYVNGISTSLPQDVQQQIVTLIDGLSNARILQWGYAVEYDFVPPEQIDASLMTKRVAGLFLAGQINGTSGYEEAAAQGLLAGINAARWLAGQPCVTLRRDQAYVGVMIDDLVTRGVTEPYRMFTSRAEHRTLLRYDNADDRLTPLGRVIGLVDDRRWSKFTQQRHIQEQLASRLAVLRVNGKSAAEWLKQPDADAATLVNRFPELGEFSDHGHIWTRVVTELKYEGYLLRERRMIERVRELESRPIPIHLDYSAIPHLRRETVERLDAIRPATLGQAGRVSGVSPADITILMVHLASLDDR
ncbi:MAG: tRNA uridine 5-carboxymethylaminomethyl modification enzyme MnmG [Phycisphaerae bacterium]|nr:tRNA uridine 5-carboxymethylaminomethyl modification enzyme MnmG [Phycisphaerae bacterium]